MPLTFNLAKSKVEVWRKVSLKADRTKKKRNLERELEKTAASKYLALSQEELQAKRAWKVVGKRVMRLVKLFPEEELEEETGHVVSRLEGRGSRGGVGQASWKILQNLLIFVVVTMPLSQRNRVGLCPIILYM